MDIAIESVQVEVNASCASVRRARTLMAYDLTLKLIVPNNGDVNHSWRLLPRDEGCKVSGKEEGGGGVDVASRDGGRVVTLLGGGNASAFCDQDVSLSSSENLKLSDLETKNLKLSDLDVQIGTSGSLCTNGTCESECPPRDKDTAAYFLDTYVRISLRSVYQS
jgi:hypothetical protein